PREITELLRGAVPGVISPDNGQGAESYAAGRGIYVRGGTTLGGALSNSLKVYLDGVELADYRQVHTIDPASIERIEILRGPQATTIHGSGALSGVMQVHTRSGAVRDGHTVDAVLSGGVIETGTGHAAVAPHMSHAASLGWRRGALSYSLTG